MKEYYVKVDKLDEYSNTGSHISGYTVPIGKYEDDIEARTGFWDVSIPSNGSIQFLLHLLMKMTYIIKIEVSIPSNGSIQFLL